MRGMVTGKGSPLILVLSHPAFMHPTFQTFYAADRLARVFAQCILADDPTHLTDGERPIGSKRFNVLLERAI